MEHGTVSKGELTRSSILEGAYQRFLIYGRSGIPHPRRFQAPRPAYGGGHTHRTERKRGSGCRLARTLYSTAGKPGFTRDTSDPEECEFVR